MEISLSVRQEQAAVLSVLRSNAGAKASLTSIAENINLDRFPGLSLVTPEHVSCTVEALRLRSVLRRSLVVSQNYVSLAEHRQRVAHFSIHRSLSYCALASTTLLAACGTNHLPQSQLPSYFGGIGFAHRSLIHSAHNEPAQASPVPRRQVVAQITPKTLPSQPLTLASASYFESDSPSWLPDSGTATALAESNPHKITSSPIQRAALETLLAENDKAFLASEKHARAAEADIWTPTPPTVTIERIALNFHAAEQSEPQPPSTEQFVDHTPAASSTVAAYLDPLPGLDPNVSEATSLASATPSEPPAPPQPAVHLAQAQSAQSKTAPVASRTFVAGTQDSTSQHAAIESTASKPEPTSAYELAKAKLDPAWQFVYRPTNFQRPDADLWVDTAQAPSITLPRLTLNFDDQQAGPDIHVAGLTAGASQPDPSLSAFKIDTDHYVVAFKNNSQRLTADIEQQALSIVRTLGKNEKVVLRGRVGKASLTQEDAKLAVARAMQVRKQLVAHGMPKENIRIVMPRTKDLLDQTSFDSPLNMSVSVYRMPADTRTASKQARSSAS